ncbi:Septum formation protein Maf [uncultured archaeon]|nr:Septum formation protein Maf [uncultured archaeon]
MDVVLASASPRRRKLLLKIAKRFRVSAANIDESIHSGEPFSKACVRLAEKKAEAVAAKEKGAVVIGADTIAYLGQRNFRKTDDGGKAKKILLFLRGKTHYVITGVCVIFPGGKKVKYSVKAAVRMKKYGEKGLASYLKSGEWKGRAGCYDISGRGKKLVAGVRGEKETVIGLPLRKLRLVLKGN